MIDVNLLPEQNVVARQDLKVKTYSVLVAIAFSVITFLIISGLTGYKAFQASEIARLGQEKIEYENRLISLTDQASDLLTLKKKAKGIAEIENNRYDFKDSFGYITGLVPADILLDEMTIKNTGEVSLNLSSENVNEVATYIKGVADDQKLDKSRLSRLDVSEDGLIDFIVQSDYGKSK